MFPSLFDGFNKNKNILANKEKLKPIKGNNSRFLQIFWTLAIRNFNSFNEICCIKILGQIIANITEQYQFFYLWNYNKITGGGDITVGEVQFKKIPVSVKLNFVTKHLLHIYSGRSLSFRFTKLMILNEHVFDHPTFTLSIFVSLY